MNPTPAPRPRIVLGVGRLANRLHLPQILRNTTAGGVVMLVATIAALLWANLAPTSYQHLSHLQLGPLSVAHWASDGILTVFFFVAGMELKREFVEGSLSRPADALVPIIAAVCGMLVPAGIYTLVNLRAGGDLSGWAIPMATDIAFALAVLAVVGKGLPMGVRAFLLTLAIVDDLGAIAVIAVFFSENLQLGWLAAAAGLLVAWWALQRQGSLRSGWWYVPIAVATWWCMLQSGVHATIAGVALGLLVRTNEYQMDDNLDRWQRRVEPWSAWVAVPVFALFAAGVPLNPGVLGGLWSDPVPLGIIAGLVVGKPIGIFLAARLATRFTKATLAEGVTWRDLAAVSVLGGIGFTVSMLISDLAFNDQGRVEVAKTAVLTASTLAAVLGGILLRARGR
ncbi:Na+/H+ antiporter NhaA [Aestuariimicrobium sp. Y1814]|uniref:Na+/H+ antiporter NhaA n=1 Tax=Aestuariimicrobium sp. Y1814 TaxID=3418742 RepID=UPI003DA77738